MPAKRIVKDEAAQRPPSRSAKKRASAALQNLGVELTRLSPDARAGLDLPQDLLEALALHDKITDREGARRQRQYIGKIMRGVDAPAIAARLAKLKNGEAVNVARFHLAEKWRDKLLAAPENELGQLSAELAALNAASPASAADMEKKAIRARELNTPAARRELFRLIAEILPYF